MADEGFKRKLAAILSADVEGYSRLMDDNEEATVRTITSYRAAITDLVQQFRGRVVDSPGDNILADFTSVVDAVNCAVEIQRDLAERNTELAYNRKMQFRIGVNLGDVIEKDGRIYGDGVNIAARVESLAQAGGICISGRTHDQVENKLGLEYEDLGMHEVKNISRPIQVYQVLSHPGAAAHRVVQAKEALGHKWRKIGFSSIAVVVLIAALGIWQFYQRRPTMEPASLEKMAFPMPDKPSIAVLPFDNLGGDSAQDYLSDGLTEQIINSLSKVPHIFVIARNSTFTYKGKPIKVQKVAENFGVRYILEGSVQKSDERVRITTQLADTITGHHLWSDRYDRELKDIFALQDEITMNIITALQVKLTEGEQARIYRKSTENLEAYFKLLHGREQLYRFSIEGNAIARKMFQEAISLDPTYAMPYRFLGTTYMLDVWYGISKSPKESLGHAIEMAQKALYLDDSTSGTHGLLSVLYTMKRQHEEAIAEGEIAITLDPNDADGYAFYGMTLRFAGRFKEAIEAHKKAIRLNPISPSWYLQTLAIANCHIGQYDEAIVLCKKVLRSEPDHMFATIALTVANVLSENEEDARITASEVLRINPKFTVQHWAKTLPYKNEADLKMYIDTLHKVGLE